jgi:YcxB-like protein
VSEAPTVIRAGYLDTEEFHIAAWEHNSKRPPIALIVQWMVPIAASVLIYFAVRDYLNGVRGWWAGLLQGFVAILLVWFLFSPTAIRWRIRRHCRKNQKNPPIKGWFEFSEEGFMATADGGSSSFHPWPKAVSATEYPDGITLYLDDVGFGCYWIPATAFASATDYSTVLARVVSKVSKFEKRRR